MKLLLPILLILILPAIAAPSKTSVRSHVTKRGTYVPRHQRTNPNASKRDNWSSKPNINPTNGKKGTVDPWKPNFRKSTTRK
jgi:hypothetical protein